MTAATAGPIRRSVDWIYGGEHRHQQETATHSTTAELAVLHDILAELRATQLAR